jgi:hypothetical protein
MGREPDEQTSPDLFSPPEARDASPPPSPPAPEATAEPVPQRHVLPKNLRGAVKRLNDEELDSLHAATLEEMKRRGRIPPSIGADSEQSPDHSSNSVIKRLPPSDKSSQRRKANIPEATLTRGQVNAVRSAFKAGITQQGLRDNLGFSNRM